MRTVTVNMGQKSYPIYISTEKWNELFEVFPKNHSLRKVLVVSDENVLPLYYDSIVPTLDTSNHIVYSIAVPAGESSKCLSSAEKLFTKALQCGLDRSSAIIALGGGVVGDLAGFVASTYMRGIDFIQLPTSLLSHVDSSVGGKVAVNHPIAKNIIGSFYQPKLVYINVRTLVDLPAVEFSSGMAELIKHAFISAPDFLHWLEHNIDKLMLLDFEALADAIAISCRIKADIVEQDEKETGVRAYLNFGHTIGHAIETLAGYSTYNHGEAVAMGMLYESLIARDMGLIDDIYINRLRSLLHHAGLPTAIDSVNTDDLVDKMYYDKKNQGGKIVFVLPTGLGKVDIFKDIDIDLIKKILTRPYNQ